MGILSTALTNLAAVPVGGVTSYALDSTPDALIPAQLPALVILPEWSGTWPGLEPSGFIAGDGQLSVQIAHVLLIAPVAGGLGLRGTLPPLIAAIDTYVEAMAADPTLDDALMIPLRLHVRPGVVRYAGVDYHGATFFHTWQLRLA
jgi:hypothetical protein